MTEDARRRFAEQIYRALVAARRDAGPALADAATRDAFDLLARDSGENKFRNAGSIVGGAKLGRPAKYDDRKTLQRIADFPPDRQREAVGAVARTMAHDPKKIAAIERRLRRKLKRTKSLCPSPQLGKADA